MEIVEGKEFLRQCSNGHPVHDDCLKEWLLHSPNCPLCNGIYSQDVVEAGKTYLEQKEKEKLNVEIRKKIEIIADKMVFLKRIDIIDKLIESNQYDLALEKLDTLNENNLQDIKRQNVLFLKGKVFFLKGKYDLAIGHLFKLVKEKFDYKDAFLYLGKAYQALGLEDKARWAFERISTNQ